LSSEAEAATRHLQEQPDNILRQIFSQDEDIALRARSASQLGVAQY
jgi:hypothetical protein